MKIILNLLLLLFCLNSFAQENPWQAHPKNILENPWISQEQKEKMIEDERKKKAEEQELKMEELRAQQIKEHNELTEKIKAEQIKDSIELANNKLTGKTSVTTTTTIPKITAEQRLKDLRERKTDIYMLGYIDSKRYYQAEGSGIGSYFLTLIPIIGNPIVWILASTTPSETTLANTDHKNREFLNDEEYSKGYKKAGKNTRAKKMMLGNFIGNLTKLIIFISIIN